MGELILLQTLFRGLDSMDQLTKIFELLGTPDEATLRRTCAEGLYIETLSTCDQTKQLVLKHPNYSRTISSHHSTRTQSKKGLQ